MNDHAATAPETLPEQTKVRRAIPPNRSGSAAVGAAAGPEDVLLLQSLRGFPVVSVLMTTTPAPMMSLSDWTRLEDLVDHASLRLRKSTADPREAQALTAALAQLTERVGTEPTDRAIGLFAGAGINRAIRLGVGVTDRVVVDHTFATRDLVLGLQRTPRHLVLVLNSRVARLFESVNDRLLPAATPMFPHAVPRARQSSSLRAGLAGADITAFLHGVDRRLGSYRAVHPSPLVLVGPDAVLSAFRSQARNLYRLAGVLTGNHVDASLTELATLIRPTVQRYLASREDEALTLIANRAGQGRVASGMPAAWLAARTQQPEMLAVEESLFYPARISDDGHTITYDRDLDQPDVLDDAVDELIEHVLIRGGWVALVRPGHLATHGGAALTLR